MAPPNTANSRITAIFYFALTTLITITTATAAAAAAAGPTATGLPVRLTNTDQLVQIGDREPYQAKLTSLAFDKPICIISLNLHTLQPLTGAEDIEITHSLCLATSSNSTWTLTHYTNNKNVFVLRHPILARRLAIVAGFGRADQNVGLTVLNLDIKQCDAQQVFGVGDDVQQEHEIYRHCKSSQNVKVDSKKERVGHRHRHRHLEEGNSTVIRINDLMADHLLPYHPDRAHFEFQQPQKEKLTHLDTTNLRRDDAVFVRHKRQVSTRTTTRKQVPQ